MPRLRKAKKPAAATMHPLECQALNVVVDSFAKRYIQSAGRDKDALNVVQKILKRQPGLRRKVQSYMTETRRLVQRRTDARKKLAAAYRAYDRHNFWFRRNWSAFERNLKTLLTAVKAWVNAGGCDADHPGIAFDIMYDVIRDAGTAWTSWTGNYQKLPDAEKIVKLLLDAGGDPDMLLHDACYYNLYDISKLLIERGADVNAKAYMYIVPWATPLHALMYYWIDNKNSNIVEDATVYRNHLQSRITNAGGITPCDLVRRQSPERQQIFLPILKKAKNA